MAMILKARHRLLTLKVTYRFWETAPDVQLELERVEDDRNVLENVWRVSPRDLGVLADSRDGELGPVQIPESVLAPLAEIIAEVARDDEPLWLHLVKPYGPLGAVDWEGSLVGRIGRALLRLPDFLERPHEDRDLLTIALVCDLPTDEPTFDVVGSVARLAMAMAEASPRRATHIHIFASLVWSEQIRRIVEAGPAKTAWHGLGREWSIAVHVPEPGPKATEPAWFDWIERAMAGQSLDLVFLLAHGCRIEQRPALALTHTPALTRNQPTTFYMGPDDLAAFLTRTGAWASGFGAPPDGITSLVRFFADSVAQARPGPVFFHELGAPAAEESFASWFAFLFATEASQPPVGAQGFVYCQPDLVSGCELPKPRESSVPTMAPEGVVALAVRRFTGDGEPAWVSAAQRFAESAALKGQRWLSVDPLTALTDTSPLPQPHGVDPSPTSSETSGGAYEAAALDDTLFELRRIVATNAHAPLEEPEA